jgi:hypothetical protein
MEDQGDAYGGFSDNPEIYGPFGESFKANLSKINEALARYNPLFELCKTALWLPCYFEKFAEFIVDERQRTKYGEQANKLSYADVQRDAPTSERVAFRRIAVIASTTPRAHSSSRVTLVSPDFKVETGGYWKVLHPSKYGEDREGRPARGRTWVSQSLSWVEREAPAPIVTGGSADLPAGPDPGRLYVMRSPFHPRGVYKIGLTRRDTEQRAKELSGTGSPEQFLVIHEWPVGDCAQVERTVHTQLARYRVNPDREFFSVEFSVIRDTIESLLQGKPQIAPPTRGAK